MLTADQHEQIAAKIYGAMIAQGGSFLTVLDLFYISAPVTMTLCR